MLYFKYLNHWNTNLIDFKNDDKQPILAWRLLKPIDSKTSIRHKDPSVITTQIIKNTIEKALSTFDDEGTLFGLFNAISRVQNRVSPFIATHSYCVKVQDCEMSGAIKMNISPIYHLGPDYANEYREQHGTELDTKAIIGLIELPTQAVNSNPDHKTFRLGIDAGIAFSGSSIVHNKELTLSLEFIHDGMMANLSCDGQTTSKAFTWDELGVLALSPQNMPSYAHYTAVSSAE